MKWKLLKKIRVWVSLLFFVCTLFIFLDFTFSLAFQFFSTILYLQFVPSLFKFINLISFSAVGFIFVVIITLFFGRVYCSSVCPLGTLQDIISNISKRGRREKRLFKYLKPNSWIKYSILIITLILISSGSILLVNLLDPYSLFGKISLNLFRPPVIWINNFLVGIFESFDQYILYRVEVKHYNPLSITFSLLMLGFILWLSLKKGRLYCNTVCPVGTVLGIISKISLYRISISEIACTQCGVCSYVCKAGCIDYENSKLDVSRCISCFNCMIVCPENGITYNRIGSNKPEKKTDPVKRQFLYNSLLLAAGILGFSKLVSGQDKPKLDSIPIYKPKPGLATTIPEDKKFHVTAPGSLSIDHFKAYCTACHLCVAVCPNQVLQPSFLEFGLSGIMQPRMDYHTAYCNYDCIRCTEVCPSGAILPVTTDDKKKIQIGKVVFIKDNCIVVTENTACGACSEHCPTKSVQMVPYEKGHHIPEVDTEICVGCGACEFACPTLPYKAIFVNGNDIHLTAKVIEASDEIKEVYLEEDFPF